MASILLWILPTFIIECLPLILATIVYEVQIILYLFFDRPTRPHPPFQSTDTVAFLPWEVPKDAESWLGILVALTCGVIWFFSEFALDLIAIVLDHDIETRNPAMTTRSSPEQYSKDLQAESCEKPASLPAEAFPSSVEPLGHPKIQGPADVALVDASVTRQSNIPLPVDVTVEQQPLRVLDTCHGEVPLPNTEPDYHEALADNTCHGTMTLTDDSMTQDMQTAVDIPASAPNKTSSGDKSFTVGTVLPAHPKVDGSVKRQIATPSASSTSLGTASKNSGASTAFEVAGFRNTNVAIPHPKTHGDLSSSKWRGGDIAPSKYPILSLTKAIEVAGFYTDHTAPPVTSPAEQVLGADSKSKTKKKRGKSKRKNKSKNKNKGGPADASGNGHPPSFSSSSTAT